MYRNLRLFKSNYQINKKSKFKTNTIYLIKSRNFSHITSKPKTFNQNYNINNEYFTKNVRNSSILAAISEKSHLIFTKLSESYPVHIAQDFLINFHDTTGLPWWATIIGSTCLLRACVTLPLGAYQQSIVAKLENITDEMRNIEHELKAETALAIKKFNWTKKEAFVVYRRSVLEINQSQQ